MPRTKPATAKLDPAKAQRQRSLRNLGYQDAYAGRPPVEQHAADPVYMESYRRGQEARKP